MNFNLWPSIPKCCYSKFFRMTAKALKKFTKRGDKASSHFIIILLSWVKSLQSNISGRKGNMLLSV